MPFCIFFDYRQGFWFYVVDNFRVSHFENPGLMDIKFIIEHDTCYHPVALCVITSDKVARCNTLLLLFHISFVVVKRWAIPVLPGGPPLYQSGYLTN